MARLYETVVIVDAMIPDEAVESEFDAIKEKLQASGKFIKLDRWGRKKLAYEIHGRTHGDYGVFYYEANSELPRELEKGFRINENILRWLTISEFPGGVPADKKEEGSEEKSESKVEAKEVAV